MLAGCLSLAKVYMNTQNSEQLSAVWLTLTNDTKLSSYVTEEDKIYFEERVRAEGLSFLTVALPKLGKSMYAAFESGVLAPVEGIKRVKGCPYPYFLRKAWETLFDKEGNLRWYAYNAGGVHNPISRYVYLEEEDMYSSAAACIAQLTLMFYKLKMPHSEQQVKDVSTSFIANEEFLKTFSLEKAVTEDFELAYVLIQARRFINRLLCGYNPLDIVPAHGSGASSCKTKPWERYGKPRFVPKLDAVFDYGTWFYSGGNGLVDKLDELASLEVHQELSARVCFVPKDSRGPRLISTEPREYMYIQQGLMTMLYKAIESNANVRSMVSCIDQSRNRRLAWWSSQHGTHATIDLKDASDLVSLELVEFLFPSNWVTALKACRSVQTELPDGTIVPLKKFAPMGSACCFPVEALVFWAISLASVARQKGTDPDGIGDWIFRSPKPVRMDIKTERLVHALSIGSEKALVHVFGDDIIVPTDCSIKVIETLEKVGLKVNRSKCFTKGPFRESCGGDYFLGRNIAPVKWNYIPETIGSKDTVNYAKFRACDSMNNLIMRYGTWELSDRFAALFGEWYHPIPQVAFRDLPNPDALFEGELDNGSDPQGLLSVLGTKSNPKGLALIDSMFITIPPLYTRKGKLVKTERMHPRHFVKQVFLECEVAVDLKIDNSDWCHVLRALLNKGGLKGTRVVSLAKRYKYRRQWVTV